MNTNRMIAMPSMLRMIVPALMATDIVNPMNAVNAPELVVFNRPEQKAAGVSQPPYDEATVEARKTFSEKLTALFQEHLSAIGAFHTLNNNEDKWMVAATIPLGQLAFRDPSGNVRQTRTTNLNLNALWQADETANKTAVTEPVQQMTFEQLEAKRKAAATARKAAK